MPRKFVFAAVMAAASVAADAAYVRGDLVWKCDFTPAEAEAHGLAARKLAANKQRGAGDDARIQRLLTTAREQLRLGQALGYATKDEMKDLLKTVDEIEDGTKNKGAATSIFDKIRERFKKATESSQPAEKK